MSTSSFQPPRTERIVEWVTGGNFALAVEVEAIIHPQRLDSPYFTPETVRYLEALRRSAEAGDVDALKQAGKVYVLLAAALPESIGEAERNGKAAAAKS